MTRGDDAGLRARWGRIGRCAACSAVLALAFGSGAWQGQPVLSAETAVRITAGEFFFAPREVAASPGAVTVVVRNEGAIEHNVVLAGTGGKSVAEVAVIEPGQTAEIKTAIHEGTYTIYCSLPGHREAGMVATLTVR
ncbi:MAG TPA: cupredoxin domain-containing protein [bacterium]|nr:cupredoxin domain-containing protein [bacterium]